MEPRDAVLQRLVNRIAEARASGTALDIRGGNTKRFYGNPQRGEPLEVSALSGITSYEPTELVITALAGTPLAEVQMTLAARGQCLSFEPPQFGSGGTVGGMVAAGLAGPARAGAGPVRDYVLGVTMINGRAEALTFGGQVMKNVAGYDVSRVLAGSMGILGVICEVSLKVMPTVPASKTISVELDQASALSQLNRWAAEPLPLSASSWHRGRLYVRWAGAAAAVDRAPRPAGSEELEPQDAARWWSDVRDHRHPYFRFTETALAEGDCLWRLAVPDTAPPLSLPGEPFIEWGGAQRWVRSSAPAPQIRAVAAAAGGHATLVRAADKSAGAFTPPSQTVMQVHRRLKQSFDPAGIFNRGRLYPEL